MSLSWYYTKKLLTHHTSQVFSSSSSFLTSFCNFICASHCMSLFPLIRPKFQLILHLKPSFSGIPSEQTLFEILRAYVPVTSVPLLPQSWSLQPVRREPPPPPTNPRRTTFYVVYTKGDGAHESGFKGMDPLKRTQFTFLRGTFWLFSHYWGCYTMWNSRGIMNLNPLVLHDLAICV